MVSPVTKAVQEVHRRERVRRRTAYLAIALATLGLLSAASRPLRTDLANLFLVVPPPIPRTAAVVLVYVSLALLFSARGLRRGSRLAWVVVLCLLGASALLHLLKGIDIAEAVVTAAGAVWLLLQHRAFPMLPARSTVVRAAIVAIVGSVLIVVLSLIVVTRAGHVGASDPGETANQLGGSHVLPFEFGGRYARDAFVAILIGVALSLLWLLLSPRALAPLAGAEHLRQRERARRLLSRYGGGTLDYFALRDDKQWFFVGNSLVAHTVRAGVCLVSPDPIGPHEEREQTWAEFMTYAERSGWPVTVLGGAAEWLPIYEATGLHGIYMGEEAIVDCRTFTLEGRPMRSLRQAHSRVSRAGYTVTFHDPATVDRETRSDLEALIPQSRRGEVERGFSMTLSRLFDAHDTGLMLTVARDEEGTPQAFVHWVPAPHIDGWSLDVMRRSTRDGLPNGIMDFLIIETIQRVRDSGGGALGLNFAMFRSVLTGEDDRRWVRSLRAVLEKASGRESFESLGQFNEKYLPTWAPRYIVVGAVDTWAREGMVMADAEGITEIPLVGRLLGKRANP